MSWHLIRPFLKPIEHLLDDPDVSDILVNGPVVFAERNGRMSCQRDVSIQEATLQVAVRNIARVLGDDVNEDNPLLDARLPDGSRVAAIIKPCSVTGTTLAIRKFHGTRYGAEALVTNGSMTQEVLSDLRSAVVACQNILISGGTGTGKTTLLNALAAFIDSEDRVVVIEDTSEISINLPNLVRLEARRAQPGLPAVTIRDLLRSTLRLRPDRILLGEVRGGEAFDLWQALSTGHQGSLATIHANSAAQALSRFTTCIQMAGIDVPYHAVRHGVAEAVNILVHVERRRGRRCVAEVLRVNHYRKDTDTYEFTSLYEHH